METKKIDRKAIFSLTDGIRIRDESFGMLIISKNAPALSLNPDSAFIIKLIDGIRSVNDIVKIACEQYNEEAVNNNIDDLFSELVNLKLIEEK
ncbi:MAG: PqqD family protein [Spirochaetaceae bacterium]|jgi:hypothetical protein|nr:PqqD family protein [Spirochaetaceae bacterium]